MTQLARWAVEQLQTMAIGNILHCSNIRCKAMTDELAAMEQWTKNQPMLCHPDLNRAFDCLSLLQLVHLLLEVVRLLQKW